MNEGWKTPPIKFDFNEHMALVTLIKKRREAIALMLKPNTGEEADLPIDEKRLRFEEEFLQRCARKLELAGEVNGHLLAAERLTEQLTEGFLDEPELS